MLVSTLNRTYLSHADSSVYLPCIALNCTHLLHCCTLAFKTHVTRVQTPIQLPRPSPPSAPGRRLPSARPAPETGGHVQGAPQAQGAALLMRWSPRCAGSSSTRGLRVAEERTRRAGTRRWSVCTGGSSGWIAESTCLVVLHGSPLLCALRLRRGLRDSRLANGVDGSRSRRGW